MTIDELKQILDTTVTSIGSIETLLPPSTDDQIISLLNSIDDNAINILFPLAQIANPALTRDQFIQAIANVEQVLNIIKTMETDGSFDKISSLCENLSNRRFLLMLLAPLL